MQKVTWLCLALLAVPAAAVNLRRRDSQHADPATPEEIKEKWSKLDEFLSVMFSMACKWKHGKDVYGAGADALRNGEVDGAAGYEAYVKDLQAKNVKGLQRACGEIIGESKKDCRESCAKNWNAVIAKRQECDQKCVDLYANFERGCSAKAEGLVKVYEAKSLKQEAQKQCYEGYCKEFPMVWMKDSEGKMKEEVTKQCGKRCEDDNVKAGCQKQWAVEVDMITAQVHSECQEKSKVSECMSDKKTKTSADYDTCKTDSKKTCDDAYKKCKTDGKTDETFKDAEAFCKDRKKMCQGQADEKCLNENKKALDKAAADCEKEASEELETCQEDTLKSKEEESEKECIAERGPKCKGDCEKKCQVSNMQACLETSSGGDDPGKLFCEDFWDMLHASSEIDPKTGDPAPAL